MLLLVLQYAARIQHASLVWFSWRGWFFGMVSVVNVVLVVHLVLGYGSCDLRGLPCQCRSFGSSAFLRWTFSGVLLVVQCGILHWE